MENEAIITEYMNYLMDRAGLEKDGEDGYSNICRKLMDTEFIPMLARDENRTDECRALRGDYEAATDIQWVGEILDGILGENGRMLELMIVMAEKMRFEMSDSEHEASTRKWITEIMDNCGMGRYARNEDYQEDAVEDILEAVIFRKIGWDGEGGLFPVFLSQRDQRRTELIAQMNDYIEENYEI